jgi:hypothetical protein
MWCSQRPVIDIDHTHGKDAGGGEKMSNGTACGVHVTPLLILTTRTEKMLEGVKQGGMWCSHRPIIDINCMHRKDAGGKEKMSNGAACGVHITPAIDPMERSPQQ